MPSFLTHYLCGCLFIQGPVTLKIYNVWKWTIDIIFCSNHASFPYLNFNVTLIFLFSIVKFFIIFLTHLCTISKASKFCLCYGADISPFSTFLSISTVMFRGFSLVFNIFHAHLYYSEFLLWILFISLSRRSPAATAGRAWSAQPVSLL